MVAGQHARGPGSQGGGRVGQQRSQAQAHGLHARGGPRRPAQHADHIVGPRRRCGLGQRAEHVFKLRPLRWGEQHAAVAADARQRQRAGDQARIAQLTQVDRQPRRQQLHRQTAGLAPLRLHADVIGPQAKAVGGDARLGMPVRLHRQREVDGRHEAGGAALQVDVEHRGGEGGGDARARLHKVINLQNHGWADGQPAATRHRAQFQRAGQRHAPGIDLDAGAGDRHCRAGGIGQQVAQLLQDGGHGRAVVAQHPLPVAAHGAQRVLHKNRQCDRHHLSMASRCRQAQQHAHRRHGRPEPGQHLLGHGVEHRAGRLGHGVRRRQVEHVLHRRRADAHFLGSQHHHRTALIVEPESGAQRLHAQRRGTRHVDQRRAARGHAGHEGQRQARQRLRLAVAQVDRAQHRTRAQLHAGCGRQLQRQGRRDAQRAAGARRGGHLHEQGQRSELQLDTRADAHAGDEERSQLVEPGHARGFHLKQAAKPAHQRRQALLRQRGQRQRRHR